jgi:hypothetical protein
MCIPPFCRICKITDDSVKSYSAIFLLMIMIASYNAHVCRDMICYYGIGSNYSHDYYHYHFYSSKKKIFLRKIRVIFSSEKGIVDGHTRI